jgi:GDP-L-fucose synthase
LYLLHEYDRGLIVNIGWGKDISIGELPELVVSAIDYKGRLLFDTTKPDGTPRKLLEVGRLTDLGWSPTIAPDAGIESTYTWFVEHLSEARL